MAVAPSRSTVFRERPEVPVTLPTFNLPDFDHALEAKERAERIIERRTIRAGRDAWEAINKTQSFEGWLQIGRALQIGHDLALRATGANAPMGRRYSLTFSQWLGEHGFGGMQKSVRSVAIELSEHAGAITAWRDSLPERQRKRLIHPLSVTRRWRASLDHGNRCPADLRRDARAAWRRFRSCLEALPADQARPLWQIALLESRTLGGYPFEESDYQQQNDRSDDGIDDRRDEAADEHKPNLRQQPTGNKSTDDADYDVANDAKPVALHD